MRASNVGEAEEGSDEDEGVEFVGVFGEDGFGDAGAEALAAEDDFGIAIGNVGGGGIGEFGFEGAEGGGFDGVFGR